MARVEPYLYFTGNCRQAMEFYKDVFGGDLSITLYGDVKEDQRPDDMPGDQVLHAYLKNDSFVIMASDVAQREYNLGNNVQVNVSCESEEEISGFFDKLSQSGKIDQKIHDTFWGAKFGKLTDQFDIPWLLNYQKN